MSVIVVISQAENAATLTRWAYEFAAASVTDLNIIIPSEGSASDESLPTESANLVSDQKEDKILASVCKELDACRKEIPQLTSTEDETESSHLVVEIRRLVSPDIIAVILERIKSLNAELLLVGKRQDTKHPSLESRLARELFSQAPCTTILLRHGQSRRRLNPRVLVPAAGGPHAAQALKTSHNLVKHHEGSLTALYVEPNTNEVSTAVGEQLLATIIDDSGIDRAERVETRVELGTDVSAAIAKVAEEGFELVLIGASNIGTIRRGLFGTLPDRILLRGEGTSLGIVRAPRSRVTLAQENFERLLDLTVPQLERKDRITLFQKLQTQSRWNFDFLALISLSTAIAGLGLIQDSTAVVIGAMLVAPLMTPLLGAGLSLVQGNFPLIKDSARAILNGFFTALGISILLGLIFPLQSLTPELIARGGPNLLDLGVAFLSGIAAAYCVARPNLSAALPGVAIAAALVPPIATTGIALANNELEIARGAATLFATNVVAIILGASLSFYAGGIRGNKESTDDNSWAKRLLFALIFATSALAIPLGLFLIASLSPSEHGRTSIPSALQEQLAQIVATSGEGTITTASLSKNEGTAKLELQISSSTVPTVAFVNSIAAATKKALGQKTEVEVTTKLVVKSVFE